MIVRAYELTLCFGTLDIQFWNKNKSMEGLSAKSVVVSFISQLIVFLYLLDNDTSWMIIMSSGVGCCIEFWKIGKAMHIEVWLLITINYSTRIALVDCSRSHIKLDLLQLGHL